MVIEWERHIFSNSQRVVERRVLKEKAHLLSDLTQVVDIKAGCFFSQNAYRPESGFTSPMMILNSTLFPVPLRPSTAIVSPRLIVR